MVVVGGLLGSLLIDLYIVSMAVELTNLTMAALLNGVIGTIFATPQHWTP